MLLQESGEPQRGFDISGLGAFVAAGQQHDHRLATSDEVNPVTRAVIDTKLRNTFADWLRVARVAKREAIDPDLDPRLGAAVRQIAEQLGELMGIEPFFEGQEGRTALLGNSSALFRLLGPPRVAPSQIIDWVAYWVQHAKPTLNKPTKYERRDGRF